MLLRLLFAFWKPKYLYAIFHAPGDNLQISGDNGSVRHETHPRQSLLITFSVCVLAGWTLFTTILHAGLTPSTRTGLEWSLGFALLVWLLRAGTGTAALAGGLLLATMDLATVTQPRGSLWATATTPLLLLLTLTLLATRFRRGSKEQSGLAEDRRGRNAAQVCANLGMASLAAALVPVPATHRLVLLAMSACFIEATADTLSSEIGQALRSKAFLLTTGQYVPPGTDGAISLPGTLAGILGGLAVALACQQALRLSFHGMLLAWLAGVAGIFFDSLLGATLERQGKIGNNAVNFCSTVFSAVLAGFAGIWVR